MPDDARMTALRVLEEMDKTALPMDRTIEKHLARNTLFDKRDRALIHAVVFGVTRWRRRLDHMIHLLSNRPVEPLAMNVLRIALFQIYFMDRIPTSAAVNTAVEMMKKMRKSRLKGFVNALLRNAIRQFDAPPIPSGASLGLTQSFPDWLVNKWMRRLGARETAALCRALNQIPPLTVRANTLRVSRDELYQEILPHVQNCVKTRYAPEGLSFFSPTMPLNDIAAFKNGWMQAQDEAAQLVAELLSPRPGQKVLDACAGLGGKTGHLAQLMQNRGSIVAVDQDPRKLALLKNEMLRLGTAIVETRQADLLRPFERAAFDRILLDAPCSGLGVIRRRPDIKWVSAKQNLAFFQRRQTRLLENLSNSLKPGGLLAYAVCSTEPEENEGVVKEFLKNHPEFAIFNKFDKALLHVRKLQQPDGFFKTYPHRHNMDGFGIICLQKR